MKPIVIILCGGRGTRLKEQAPGLPKPLVEIGGRPILWHVIQIYLAQGFRRFLLRGLAKIRGEWRLVCLTHNLLKIWRYGGDLLRSSRCALID